MNQRFLAVCMWVFAWILIDVTAVAAIGALGRRERALAAAAAGSFVAAALINAGADLW